MGSERWRVASSDASPSSAASSSSSAEADRMELEAAEALAVLAHSVAREESGGGFANDREGGKWGGKGKRAKSKRVKSESPPDDSVFNPVPVVDSVPTRSDPPLDRGVAAEDQGGPTGCRNVPPGPAKAVPEAELPKPSPTCVRSHHGVGGGKSRQNLTEDEKEARRLRRILANRESARQTIRRRQAICEELTKKAADLAWENENLKREKELALRECHSLELVNKRLKEQMAKTLKDEMEEARDLKLVCDDKFSTQRTNGIALVKERQPFSPLCWPSVAQSSNVHSQNGTQNGVLPTSIPIQANGKFESSWPQQENGFQVNVPRAPLYLVPCPWFFPVPEHGSGFLPRPTFGINHLQEANSGSNLCQDIAPSSAAGSTENLFPLQVKSEATSPGEVRLITDLNEAPVGCLPDEGSDEWLLTSLALSSVTPAIPVKNEISFWSEQSPVRGNPVRPSQMPNDFAHRNLHHCNFQGKQLVDAAAAAEARRKRKELTRLKNLQGRQCKTSC